jgi:hypothetical protein
LTPKLDTLSFIPWFTARDLTAVGACETRPYQINSLLAMPSGDNHAFRTVYFATLDVESIGKLAPPRLRVIRP